MADLIRISSEDRYTGGNPSNFQILAPSVVSGKKHFELVSCSIPLNLYNVSSLNNTISYNDGSARAVAVNPGYYTTTSLLSALVTAMNALGGGTYSAVYNDTTKRTTITGSLSFFFNLTQASPLLESLGWVLTGTTSAFGLSQVSDLAPVLWPLDLYITVDQLGPNEIESTGNRSYSFEIPIITSNGQINQVTKAEFGKQKITVTSMNTRNWHIKVIDSKMRPISLFSDWNFTLAVS